MGAAGRWSRLIPWALFMGWYGLLGLVMIGQIVNANQLPIDYRAYERARRAIERAESPYLSPEATRQIWLSIHQYETDVLTGQGQVGDRVLVGPYVYPPTLALWLGRLGGGPVVFVLLLLGALFGFGLLWLKSSAATGWWLLLIVGSLDVMAALGTGNVELLLLFLALLSAWLLFTRRGLWAAPVITLVLLIKPFYALLFAAFGLLLLAQAADRRIVLKTLSIAALGVLILLGLEVMGWGGRLRAQGLSYLANGLAYQWLVLPVEQQTPLSLWNRTLMQGLVNLGIAAGPAQFGSLVLGGLLLAGTAGRVWDYRLPFAALFALAFVIFYWVRPVGWGFVFLEFVVLVALWPALSGRLQRGLALGAMLALMLSHWLALLYTIRGDWIRLMTLQSAEVPWETWLVLPLCWAALMWAVPRYKS